MIIDVVPFLVLVHLCLLGSFDSFWRQFSQVHVFLIWGTFFSVFSCSASNLFLNSNAYLFLMSLLLSRAQYFGRDYSMIGGHTLERGVCLAIHRTIFPFPVYKDVVYLCFTIIRVCVGP